ncbi:MAG: FAD binding domain-containing protein, partial [Planctomycetota bacterium]
SKGVETWKIDDIWKADGAFNKKVAGNQLLTRIRIPAQSAGHHGAYGKLRDRGSIDYPLLGVAVRVDLGDDGAVADADVVLVALQARPVRLRKVADVLNGTRPGSDAFRQAVDDVAESAYKQCHPMPNIPGDHDYRREMVPVFTRRTLLAAVEGTGPVHHV